MSYYSPAQRLEALDRANQARITQARIRREIAALSPRDGKMAVVLMLHEPDEDVGSMRVGRLLTAIRRVSMRQAETWCKVTEISSDRRIRELTPRQLQMLRWCLR